MVVIGNVIILSGLFIILLGIIGMIILPDIFLRFHASTKCGVTGVVTVLLGLIFHTESFTEIIKILLIIFFLVFTAPITVHMLAISFIGHNKNSKDEDNKEGENA